MPQHLGLVSIVVRDYDEAIAFYVGTLGFLLVEDTHLPEPDKRWVVVSPPGATESRLLLARATNDPQKAHVGNQTGGRVFLFLYTDDFWRDFHAYTNRGGFRPGTPDRGLRHRRGLPRPARKLVGFDTTGHPPAPPVRL